LTLAFAGREHTSTREVLWNFRQNLMLPGGCAEMVERLQVPFEVLSDAEFRFCEALRLPTFEVQDMRLVKRLTLVIRDGVIETVFYPVFPPNQSAAQVINRLKLNPAA
jgi:peroxiredoxin